MRKIIIIASLLLVTLGCQVESNNPDFDSNAPSFTAAIENFDTDTKTTLDHQRNILWTSGDQIAIFQSSSAPTKYQLNEEHDGSTNGSFSLVSGEQNGNSQSNEYVALYPYMKDIQLTASNNGYNISGIRLVQKQSYVAESFADDALLMAAYSSNHSLDFKNVMGAMKLQFKGTDKIKSITIKGNDDEKLSGKATITVYSDKVPEIEMADDAVTTVTLDCGDGVQLSPNTATTFIIALPPVQFSNGFKVTVGTTDNNVRTLDATKTNSILRSSILVMPTVTLEEDIEEFPEPDLNGMTRILYSESTDIIPNPERGFYKGQEYYSSDGSSKWYKISESKIESSRVEGITLFFTHYYLHEYVSRDIADNFLEMISENLAGMRENGAKCIVRFSYQHSQNEHPYDATIDWVERHLEQLTPILTEYSDVILCLQAGFVGVYGEWYYTDNFKDNYDLRTRVIDAMLEALPKDRSVAVRTPQYKKEMYANSYSDSLTLATAYNQSDIARISSFNDCFVSSANDVGTYESDAARMYWQKESRYVLMGGETCKPVSPYCECEHTLDELEKYHWTYLNSGYRQEVINGWATEGCLDEIKRRLGYRLHVSEVLYSTDAYAGKDFHINVKIKNTGYAAPMNGRGVELILKNNHGNTEVFDLSDQIDPRYWFAGGEYTIDTVIRLPESTGTYTLYLNLPDPKTTLHDNPYFSIRLANEENIWDESTGYNKLFDFSVLDSEPAPNPDEDEIPGSASGDDLTYDSEYNPW